MTKLDESIQKIRNELAADFVGTDVVGMDGMSIAGLSLDPNYDNSVASANFSMVMKLGEKVCAKTNMGKLDDNLVTTDKVYILTRFLGNGEYFWGLTVTRNATLGSVRMLMNEYADQLWDAIPR